MDICNDDYAFPTDSIGKRCLKRSKDQKLARQTAEWKKGQGAPKGCWWR